MTKIAAIERNALSYIANGQHSGIVKLYWKFQDQWSWCQYQLCFLFVSVHWLIFTFRFHLGLNSKWQSTVLD